MIFGIDELRFGYQTKGPCREPQDWPRSTKPDQDLIHDRPLWWINNHRFIESRVGRTISHRTLLFIIYIYTYSRSFFEKPVDLMITGALSAAENRRSVTILKTGQLFYGAKHITLEKGWCCFLGSKCKMGWQKWYQKDVLFFWRLFFWWCIFRS